MYLTYEYNVQYMTTPYMYNVLFFHRHVRVEDGQHGFHLEKAKLDYYNSNTLKFFLESA